MRFLIFTFIIFLCIVARPVQAANEPTLLAVPFTMQAPFGNWSWPWSDFCEEASVTMAHAFVSGRTPSVTDFAIEMLQLAVFELKNLGYEKDTGVVDTLKMVREHYLLTKSRIVYEPTSDTIKEAMQGYPVMVPVAGRMLANTHFKAPGPRYHMVVVKGFDHADFIVNEPGTKYGNGWRYSQATLMSAMHDLVEGDMTKGRKAVIIIEK